MTAKVYTVLLGLELNIDKVIATNFTPAEVTEDVAAQLVAELAGEPALEGSDDPTSKNYGKIGVAPRKDIHVEIERDGRVVTFGPPRLEPEPAPAVQEGATVPPAPAAPFMRGASKSKSSRSTAPDAEAPEQKE